MIFGALWGRGQTYEQDDHTLLFAERQKPGSRDKAVRGLGGQDLGITKKGTWKQDALGTTACEH